MKRIVILALCLLSACSHKPEQIKQPIKISNQDGDGYKFELWKYPDGTYWIVNPQNGYKVQTYK